MPRLNQSHAFFICQGLACKCSCKSLLVMASVTNSDNLSRACSLISMDLSRLAASQIALSSSTAAACCGVHSLGSCRNMCSEAACTASCSSVSTFRPRLLSNRIKSPSAVDSPRTSCPSSPLRLSTILMSVLPSSFHTRCATAYSTEPFSKVFASASMALGAERARICAITSSGKGRSSAFSVEYSTPFSPAFLRPASTSLGSNCESTMCWAYCRTAMGASGFLATVSM